MSDAPQERKEVRLENHVFEKGAACISVRSTKGGPVMLFSFAEWNDIDAAIRYGPLKNFSTPSPR